MIRPELATRLTTEHDALRAEQIARLERIAHAAHDQIVRLDNRIADLDRRRADQIERLAARIADLERTIAEMEQSAP